MKKILVVTVGGSCQPIVTSLKMHEPDVVYFICSDDTDTVRGSYRMVDGEGKVCGANQDRPDLPNILTQARRTLTEHDQIIKIREFDDLNSCFQRSFEILSSLRSKYPDAQIIADYSGGTKTMSAGLGAAAIDVPDITIGLVSGQRTNLVRVSDGTQSVRFASANSALIQRMQNMVDQFLQRFDYSSAAKVVEEILQRSSDVREQELNQRRLTALRAFDAWDRFDHNEALRLLTNVRKWYVPYVQFLEKMVAARRDIEDTRKAMSESGPVRGTGLLEDLLLNIERRVRQERYDDAVARLYRAFELTAQLVLLFRYGQDTGNVELHRLPEALRNKYQSFWNKNGTIKISLVQSFELLADLGDDVGRLYQEQKSEVLDKLHVRNDSILAHGYTPIDRERFNSMNQVIGRFVKEVVKNLNGVGSVQRQFPNSLQQLDGQNM